MAISEATATEPGTIPTKRTRRKPLKVAQPEPKASGTWRDLKAAMARFKGIVWQIDHEGKWSKVNAVEATTRGLPVLTRERLKVGKQCRLRAWLFEGSKVSDPGAKFLASLTTSHEGINVSIDYDFSFIVAGTPALAAASRWFDDFVGPKA